MINYILCILTISISNSGLVERWTDFNLFGVFLLMTCEICAIKLSILVLCILTFIHFMSYLASYLFAKRILNIYILTIIIAVFILIILFVFNIIRTC